MKKIAILVLMSLTGLFTQKSVTAQTPVKPSPAIQVIQFHSEHRCVTCLKIEKLTKITLAAHFPALSLTLVNVEDKKNSKMVEQFEATGTALFLYNPKTGVRKELTDFAFMRAGNEKLFDTELKKFIEEFLKG